MEFNINIIDSFPSLNKFAQKNNLILELNNKEYNLKKLITQQDIISIKENLSQILLKVYALSNNKKILIGLNQLNSDIFSSDKKCSIIWLEFKKKIEENKKEINDINLLFYDCIRLKIKISLIKTPSKSDKKIKTSKSKLKFGSPNDQRKSSQKAYNNEIKDINLIKSCRIVNPNKYLLKSQTLKENIKVNNVGNVDENNLNVNTQKAKALISENKENQILEKFNNFEIDSQKSISHEYMKDLVLESDCLLTDNNIFGNHSLSNSQRGNNIKNINEKINASDFKKKEININIAKIKENNITDIKTNNNNCDIILQNSLICPNNFSKMIKNILKSDEENKNNNIFKRDTSFNNKKINIIKDESFNNSNTIRKLKMQHKKNKSFNKIIYNNNNNNNNKAIKNTKNNITKNNLKIKSNHINNNNNNSLSKENLLKECYTLNDFYNCKMIRNSFKEIKEIDKNKDLSLVENKNKNDYNNTNLNELLISQMKESSTQNQIIEEDEISKDYNEDEKVKSDEFSSVKKDYDLFYTLKFIRSIKNDLLDLEFNIAIDKSLSLFILYNKDINNIYKRKNELINIIKNYTSKIRQIYKKIDKIDNIKRKNELKKKNDLIFKDPLSDLYNAKLHQKKIFETLIYDKINKKEKLKSIITSLLKKQTSLLDILNKDKDKNKKIENEEKIIIKKIFGQSPSKGQYKSPKKNDNMIKKKESNELFFETKNEKYKNNIMDNNNNKNNDKKVLKKKNKSVKNNLVVKTILNKNLEKNNSINNLLSYENLNKRNSVCSDKAYNKEYKSGEINNIHVVHKNVGNGKNNNKSIYYSTARTNFYSFNTGKFK